MLTLYTYIKTNNENVCESTNGKRKSATHQEADETNALCYLFCFMYIRDLVFQT